MIEEYKNSYTLPTNFSTFPTVLRVPQPREEELFTQQSLTPLTVHNNWPESVDNESIFKYLLKDDEFSRFVRTWYKCSCAIVYKKNPADQEGKILATGTLIAADTISTARHAFNTFPLNNLCARFFHYESEISVDRRNYIISEYYIDIPFISSDWAVAGLDAGYLYFDPWFVLDSQQRRYLSCVLPINFNAVPTLPEGHYAMFHFAGGVHSISLGYLRLPVTGVPLPQAIDIQGGPGASGATIIWKSFDSIAGYGISIYREISYGNMQRRVIPYYEFQYGGWTDPIKNPYLNYRSFAYSINPADDSYEFLLWTDERYRGLRVDSPDEEIYNINGEYSNHHIIPIAHLLFLWDYLHEIDVIEKRDLEQKVRIITNDATQRVRQRCLEKISRECSTWDNQAANSRNKKHFEDEMKEKIEKIKNDAFETERKEYLKSKYAEIVSYIEKLCPIRHFSRSGFAWSWWNLFKGYKRAYRTDDPADHFDPQKNEKQKPRDFNENIWSAVQDLYQTIDSLAQVRHVPCTNYVLEEQLAANLKNLAGQWHKVRDKKIHKFNPDEWEFAAHKYGKDKYRVKQ
jgi:hypothetical protein